MGMVLFPMMSGPQHLDTGKSRKLSKDVDELRMHGAVGANAHHLASAVAEINQLASALETR